MTRSLVLIRKFKISHSRYLPTLATIILILLINNNNLTRKPFNPRFNDNQHNRGTSSNYARKIAIVWTFFFYISCIGPTLKATYILFGIWFSTVATKLNSVLSETVSFTSWIFRKLKIQLEIAAIRIGNWATVFRYRTSSSKPTNYLVEQNRRYIVLLLVTT